MKDTILCGSLSGMTGGLVQIVYSIILRARFGMQRIFMEFAKNAFMSRVFPGFLADIVGSVILLFFDAVIGILFLLYIRTFSSNHYYLKSLLYGAFIWTVLGMAGNSLRLSLFQNIPPLQALIVLIGAILYSLTTAFVLRRLTA